MGAFAGVNAPVLSQGILYIFNAEKVVKKVIAVFRLNTFLRWLPCFKERDL